MKKIILVKIRDDLFINPESITSIRFCKRGGWTVYDGEGRFGIDLTDNEYEKLSPFLAIMETPSDSILFDLSDDIDNFATDLWGGAGPDCINERLVAAEI